GEPEVVLRKGVFRVVAAAEQTLAALDAASARGALAAEVGIGDRHARLAEVDADACRLKALWHTEIRRHPQQQLIGLRSPRMCDDAEHPFGLAVVLVEVTGIAADVAPFGE